MTLRKDPKWKREGFASEAEYRSACAATRATKKASLAATGMKNTPQNILRIMWADADFHRPIVTITKEQIMAKANCCLWSVKQALKALREEGSIKPIRNGKGGRSVPTTWLLGVAGQQSTPSDQHVAELEEKRSREAAWRFLSQKYGPAKALEIMGSEE